MISRTVRKLLRKIRKIPGERKIHHPFDAVPRDLDVKWVLDVGANDGGLARAALRTYPECSIICFEPVRSTFELLKTTLAPYRGRVYLYNEALSDRSGTGEIHLTNFHGANSIEPQASFHRLFNPHVREEGKEEITLARLDDVSAGFPTRVIDIMKIDVEGHEVNVLRGGATFLRSCVDTLIIEVALMRDASQENQAVFEIFSLLNDCGFALVNIFDLHPADNPDLMLAQMDCVFRHRSKFFGARIA